MTPSARPHRLAALTAVALVVAACSTDEGAAPPSLPPALPTTTVQTTTAPETTPETTAAPTTTAESTTTSTPTTTVPPTTAVPVPTGDPTTAATPIFAGSSSDAWLYLGRWTASGWERAFDGGGAPVAYDLPDGINVVISELGQTAVAGVTGAAGEACPDEATGGILGPIITPNAGVPDEPGFGYRAIALPTAWETRPRDAVVIDEAIAAYANAGVAAFADAGVETQAGEIDQTVVTDLDGDGDTEVLVVFGHENERVEGQDGPVGGFSALLLIDADTQTVSEVAKSFTPIQTEGDVAQPFDTFRVLDVADLNGDGIAEVAVHTWFTGGASVSIHTYDGSTLTEVLLAGCGA